MITYSLILNLVLLVEVIFRPRILVTNEKDVLLWYGGENRHYIKIFKLWQ
jgi:hypothetical protein